MLAAIAALALLRAGGPVFDLPDPEHDPEQVRRAADEILERPEYQWTDQRSLIERIGEWVAEQLGRLTAPLGVGAVPVWVGWLVLALLAALVGILVYRARGGWLRQRVPGARASGKVVVSPDDEAVDWAAEVERCEAAGRWRDGVRARYRVLVGELATQGVIPDAAGRTAGELAADVRAGAPAVAPAFTAATALFEAVWYGHADCGPAERDRFARLAADARAAALAGPERVHR